MKTYIVFDAGCNIWEVKRFNPAIDWHNEQFKGTYKECTDEASRQMEPSKPHYINAPYGSIWDY